MSSYDYDLVVLGGGSGGVGLARRAASYGAKVAVCEEDRYGGTCVHRGCVPKKLLVYASQYADDLRDMAGYGHHLGETSFSWPELVAAKDKELDRLNGFYNRMLEENKITRATGRARLQDRHTVEVEGFGTLTAATVCIAVGGWPFKPKVPGIERAFTSNEAFHLEKLPRRLAIVGSGYIGIEFAGIFHGLGSEVTLLFRSERVLPKFDEDIRLTLQEEMEKRGIRILPNSKVKALEEGRLLLEDGTAIETDAVMYATGRNPNTHGLGLEEAGVKLGRHQEVTVDEDSRTSVDNIYAIGDCTDRVQLTPVAIAEGRALAETLYNQNPTRVSYHNIPTAVFSLPPVGTVGLSEAEAREKGPVRIYRTRFRPMRHNLSGRDTRVMMKLVVDDASDKVVGVHMVGADSPEIIQAMGIALQAGATKAVFDRTLALHPSTAEEFVLMREPVK